MASKAKTLQAIVSIAGQIDPSLQKSLAGATKQFGGMKLGMAAVGTVAIATAGAIVKFGADAVKSAATFEKEMSNVATLLNGTKEQVSTRIQELGDDVLSVSNKTGVATGELSDGLYQIISAVGDSKDAITQMELAAKAAKAGNATTTDSINLLTAVTKGYNDTSGEAFEKASDLAFTAVKLGQTSFPELAASIGKVIPLASSLNVSQEELFGSFAALTGVTGSTAEVATQMKAVMSGLMSPSKNMTDALKKLGYANANVALESLGLQGTLDALGSVVGGDTMQLAKMFSSVEAQTAILSLAGAQAEDFKNKTQAMYDAAGATNTAFEAQTDNLEYTIACIKNIGANFMTQMGRKMLPTVKSLAEKALPMIVTGFDKFGIMIESLHQKASPFIQQALPVAKELLSAIALVITTLTPAISFLANVLSNGIGNALQTIVIPILKNFIGLLTGICDFITNVFTGNWKGAWDAVGQIFSNVWQGLVGIAKAPINAIACMINGVIQGINGMTIDIPDWVPILGGKKFALNLPELPMLAAGGFTNGTSIAGEAGQEAVISFDPNYRSENISYWARAGRMLGIDDNFLSSMISGTGNGAVGIHVNFAPQITINGTGNADTDLISALKQYEEEFMDMLEDMLNRRGGEQYGYIG